MKHRSKKGIPSRMFNCRYSLISAVVILLFFFTAPLLRADDPLDGLGDQRTIAEGVHGVGLGQYENDPSSTGLSDRPAMSTPFSGGAIGGDSPSLQGLFGGGQSGYTTTEDDEDHEDLSFSFT